MVGQSLGMVVEKEVKRSRCSNVRARRAVDDDVYLLLLATYAGTRMQFSELDTHLPPERQEMRQKSNRVTPGKFVRSFDWSSVRALKTTRLACFGRGGVEKSIKQSKFSPAPTAGVFAIKTIHSKVFSEFLYLQ